MSSLDTLISDLAKLYACPVHVVRDRLELLALLDDSTLVEAADQCMQYTRWRAADDTDCDDIDDTVEGHAGGIGGVLLPIVQPIFIPIPVLSWGRSDSLFFNLVQQGHNAADQCSRILWDAFTYDTDWPSVKPVILSFVQHLSICYIGVKLEGSQGLASR